MDIGNGNIASVRLAAISARTGWLVSEKTYRESPSLNVSRYCQIERLRCEVLWSRLRILDVAEVAVTIIFRVIVGVVCDVLGARRGLAFLLFLACPGILGMMSAAGQEWMGGSEGEGALVAIPAPIEVRRM